MTQTKRTTSFDDRMLKIAIAAIRIVTIILWVAIAMILPAIAGVWVFSDSLIAKITEHGLRLIPYFMPLLTVVMLGAAGLCLLGILFLRKLLAIVQTVETDPFVPDNAQRLRAMAWLLLAAEVGGFVIGLIARPLLATPPRGFDFSATGLIAVLSLFVLARVFTRGTELRDEIEGTV